MRKRLLLTLAKHLDEFQMSELRRFNLWGWGNNTTCGTVCCAVGLATEIPKIRRAGLRALCEVEDSDSREPVLGELKNWRAVERLFRITNEQAQYLFYPARYTERGSTRPKTVAKRIRQFVRSGGKIPSR